MVDYILQLKKTLVLSFCGSRFDNVLLLEDILTRKDMKPQVVLKGTNLLVMSIKTVRCKDVYLFMPSSLANCGKEFGLKVRKSFYPLKLLTIENLGKKMKLNKEDFNYAGMDQARRVDFDQFYKEKVAGGKRFNMKEELEAYCR